MKIRAGLFAAAMIALVSFAVAGSAGAATKAEPSAQVVGKVKINKDGTGTIKAHYICSGENWHLWASAKQTADGTMSEDVAGEGSGFEGVADNWLQSHPTPTCDGKWHTEKFEINTEEELFPGGPTVGRGELVPGYAWVQFCLIQGEEGQDPTAFLVDQAWRKVG